MKKAGEDILREKWHVPDGDCHTSLCQPYRAEIAAQEAGRGIGRLAKYCRQRGGKSRSISFVM